MKIPASTPLPFITFRIRDEFWEPKLRINRQVSLPFQYEQLSKTGRLEALRLKWTPHSGKPVPHHFWDSDTAKWVEAASYCLALQPEAALEARVNEIVELFAHAQQDDGYLNSCFTVWNPHLRWKNLQDNHELYCAGHIFEAAVAHFEATGSRRFLNVAIRYADYIATVFGREAGKLRGYCGHEEIELALVRLFQATGERRFLDLASYFVEERGQLPAYFPQETDTGPRNHLFGLAYYQAHLPVREQPEAIGHAVRAVYLYCAMADLARCLEDDSLQEACEKLWRNVAETRLYVTGQIGSSHHGEAFTHNYDLPNEPAYCETCAGVGLIMWNHRMLQLDCDSRYADLIERSLYNGVLGGMALDGKSFFYHNPLADRGRHRRSEWFACSCCPSNLSRLLASLGTYIASTTAQGLILHQYVGGDFKCRTPGGSTLSAQIQTGYPWMGKIKLTLEVDQSECFEIALRIPGWCREAAISLNGEPVSPGRKKGYAIIDRTWQSGDYLEMDFAMPVEQLVAHPSVLMNHAQVALQRGPLVYCLEDADHETSVFSLNLPPDATFVPKFTSELGGVIVLEGEAETTSEREWSGKIYRPVGEVKRQATRLKAIPYFAWANRKPGAMTVWLAKS